MSEGRRITLADIAKRAGCHPTTVSMALRNHQRLPQSTIDRIKALAKEMGYRPDPALGALVAYRRNTSQSPKAAPLAYLTGWNSRYGWQEAPAHRDFYQGAKERAEAIGYKLEHFWLSDPSFGAGRINEILQTRGIQGILLASQAPDANQKIDLEWDRFSTVKIDFFPKTAPVHTISNDQRMIMQTAFEKALEAGYRRIGLVMPYLWDNYVNKAWSAGFLTSQLSLPEQERLPILHFSFRQSPDRAVSTPVLQEWIDTNQPDLIISQKTFVQKPLDALGLKIPHDIAYIDIFKDDQDQAFAGMKHNCLRVGELAVEILAGQLQQNQFGLPQIPTSTKVEGTWIDGASLPSRDTLSNHLAESEACS